MEMDSKIKLFNFDSIVRKEGGLGSRPNDGRRLTLCTSVESKTFQAATTFLFHEVYCMSDGGEAETGSSYLENLVA